MLNGSGTEQRRQGPMLGTRRNELAVWRARLARCRMPWLARSSSGSGRESEHLWPGGRDGATVCRDYFVWHEPVP